MINLHGTSNCRRQTACDACGTEQHLDVGTCTTPMGVLCLTLCPRCAGADLQLSPPEATEKALIHCEHLGIDLEQMSIAICEGSRR